MTYTANPQQRNYFSLGLLVLAALPFMVAVGVLPALLAALLAWGSRQIHGARQYAMYSSVYAGISVFFMPPFDFPVVFFDRLAPFFLVVALGFFLGSALDGVQDSTFWAWLAPLVLFLVFPSAWGAVAVLGLALLAALEKQKDTLGNRLYSLETNHLWRLGGVVVLVAAIGFFLPRVASFEDPTKPIAASPPTANKPIEEPKLITTGPKKNVPNQIKQADSLQESFFASTTALLFVVVVVLAAFLFRSKLEQRKNKPNNSLWDFVPVIGVLILALAILLASLNAPPNIPAGKEQLMNFGATLGAAPNQSSQPPKDIVENKKTSNLASWLPYAMGALALLLLFWLFRRASQQFALPPEPEPELIPNPEPTQAATNRVRQAYLAFLEVAARRGVPRSAAETPLEFVRRFGEQFPQLVAPAQILTELYEPVRYGRLAAEPHALAAEGALAEITRN